MRLVWTLAAALALLGALCLPYLAVADRARNRAAWAPRLKDPTWSVRVRYGWAMTVPVLLAAGGMLLGVAFAALVLEHFGLARLP